MAGVTTHRIEASPLKCKLKKVLRAFELEGGERGEPGKEGGGEI